MIKRYKYRAYPTKQQEHILTQQYGCARVVYNDLITARENARNNQEPYFTYVQASNLLITQAKQTPEREWLRNTSSRVLQQSLRDADRAYRNFFNGLKGKQKNRVGAPRYKSRKNTQSIEYMIQDVRTRSINTKRVKLRLPKVGELELRISRELPTKIKSVRIIKDKTGAYYASFVVDIPTTPLEQTIVVAGVDLGLEHLAIIARSNGERYKVVNPRYERLAHTRVSRAQRALSHKRKGSKNREKARVRLARAHIKVVNQRLDHAHKVALKLIRDNQTVALETLCVKGLARTRLARSIHDAGWSTLVRLIQEKAVQYEREVIRIDRFAPTSQVCSVCGVLDGKKPLSVRIWECTGCGAVLDRDYNAALNILLAAGLAESLNACGENIRRGLALAGSRVSR